MQSETPTPATQPCSDEVLLPCPFCGGEAEMIHPMGHWSKDFAKPGRVGGYGPDGSRIVCSKEDCSGCGWPFYGPDQDAEAIKWWNARPPFAAGPGTQGPRGGGGGSFAQHRQLG